MAALEHVKASGRRLILVTGRQIDDVIRAFPEIGVFDRVVGENGAVLFDPKTQKTTLLAEAPPTGAARATRDVAGELERARVRARGLARRYGLGLCSEVD